MKKIYQAEDGWLFDTKKECKAHEQLCQRTEKLYEFFEAFEKEVTFNPGPVDYSLYIVDHLSELIDILEDIKSLS